jgi:hypothetical protein
MLVTYSCLTAIADFFFFVFFVIFLLSSVFAFAFIFFFTELGDSTQGLVLARQVLYHLSHSSSPFCIDCF